MALGINYQNADSVDIIPIVKYDAKAGRAFRVDRIDGANTPIDITSNFKAVMDLANIEIGWISFAANSAPDFRLVPIGQPTGPKPSENHKEGFRLLCKLGRDCGGDVREIATTAKVALAGFDQLHNDYLEASQSKAGKLPVVTLVRTIPVTTGSGSNKSTNYRPEFKIVSWVERPADLVAKPRGGGAATPQLRIVAEDKPSRPSTGSTVVKAPAAIEASNEEDFG